MDGSGGATIPGSGTGGISSMGGAGGGPNLGGKGVGGDKGGAPSVSSGGAGGQGVAGAGGRLAGSGGASSTGGSSGTAGASSGGASGAGSGGTGVGGAGGKADQSGSGGGVSASGGSGQGGRGAGGNGGGTPNGGNAGTAGPRILSIDFVGGEASGGAGGFIGVVPMAANETAGVKRAQNWNSAPGAMGSLTSPVLADGSVATATVVTWNAPNYPDNPGVWRLAYADQPGDIRMMNGLLNPCWSSPPSASVDVISISNLPSTLTSGGYDVYVYVLGGIRDSETRSYLYTIGTTTSNVSQTGPTPTTPPTPYLYTLAPNMSAGNYVVFRQIKGSSFTLSVKPGNTTGVFRAPINGIQLVWPSGS